MWRLARWPCTGTRISVRVITLTAVGCSLVALYRWGITPMGVGLTGRGERFRSPLPCLIVSPRTVFVEHPTPAGRWGAIIPEGRAMDGNAISWVFDETAKSLPPLWQSIDGKPQIKRGPMEGARKDLPIRPGQNLGARRGDSRSPMEQGIREKPHHIRDCRPPETPSFRSRASPGLPGWDSGRRAATSCRWSFPDARSGRGNR